MISIPKFDLIPIRDNLLPYELILSKLEEIRYIESPMNFHRETAYYKYIDGKESHISHFQKINVRKGVVKTNPGSNYITHGFDLYQGSFHAQMVRALINYCNLQKNSVLLDPFCGSGTSLIEARLLGFNSIGIDLNPTACLNSLVKTQILTTPLEILLLNNKKFFELDYYSRKFPIQNFSKFLKRSIKELFFVFLYTRAISENKFYKIPIEKSFTQNYYRNINALKAFNTMKSNLKISLGNVSIYNSDSLELLQKIKTNSIDCIITSPPYLDLIDFFRNDSIQNNFLLSEYRIKHLSKKCIGRQTSKRSLTKIQYSIDIEKFFEMSFNILKPDAKFIILISNFNGILQLFINNAKKFSFNIERVLKRDIKNKLKNRIAEEYIIFLEKNEK